MCIFSVFIFFFKQKTAYEMRISDWSSDVCSSDLESLGARAAHSLRVHGAQRALQALQDRRHHHLLRLCAHPAARRGGAPPGGGQGGGRQGGRRRPRRRRAQSRDVALLRGHPRAGAPPYRVVEEPARSEEHTSELPSLMRNPYPVFCL